MLRRTSVIPTLTLCLPLLVAACRAAPPTPLPATPAAAPTRPAPTATIAPSPSPTLAPAESDAPAAGICAQADGEWATVEVSADVPSPRCLRVTRNQRLRVVNKGPAAVQVKLAGYTVVVPAGGEGTIPAAFGAYLAAGVHSVSADPYSGPQVWLVGR